MEKIKKLAKKLAKEAQKSRRRRKLPKIPTHNNPFIDDPIDPSNPFY